MVTEPEAVTVTVCTVELLTVTVHVRTLPLPEGLAQVLLVKVAPLGVIEKLLTGCPPGSAFRVMVTFSRRRSSYLPLGVMWMLASTQLLVAGPDELWVPSV